MKKAKLIGIAGGTGSGKTLVVKALCESIDAGEFIYLQQDSYYKDLSELPMYERGKRNFDHPDAFDSELLHQQTRQLLEGKAIEQPVYDFKKHSRTTLTTRIEPRPLIILEGILVLHDMVLREMMDIKVFVDTPSDIRLIRRVRRDIAERGRDMDSVFYQYENSVRPMHIQFVEPSKEFADIIIPEGGMNIVAVDMLSTKLKAMLEK